MKRKKSRSRSQLRFNRRNALKMGASTAAAVSALDLLTQKANAQVAATNPAEKLLFVITATGGGSIVDSLLAQRESDVTGAAGNPADMIAYPDQFVSLHGGVGAGTEIRSLNFPIDDADPNFQYRNALGGGGTLFTQSDFVTEHLNDLAVMTVENTSVNHFIAQSRAVNGAGIDGGRTIGERVAERYGQGLALPFVNMANGGYLEPGSNPNVASSSRHEPVVVPSLFPLSADGVRGVVGAPGSDAGAAASAAQLPRTRELMARARQVRDQLDDTSMFGQTFQCGELRKNYLDRRVFAANNLEANDLISNLMYLNELDVQEFGLSQVPPEVIAARAAVTAMPGGQLDRSPFFDPWYGQILLGYLLARFGYSTAIQMGVPFSTDLNNVDVNPPLSFDFSHTNHVAGQAQMWSRVLDGADKLVRLLKATDDGAGGTLWDRSMVYIASDFGRDKVRLQSGAPLIGGTSTGHHLNNGAILLSPALNGGRVYGGINPSTLLTHGFNRNTGVADPTTLMREGDIYSVVCQALGVDFVGREDIPIMIRA